MFYALLADVVVAIHIAYVSYVIFGELAILLGLFFKWEWTRNLWFRWTHLIAIVIVAAEAIVGFTCPLTKWETALRKWAGEEPSEMSFIGRVLNDVLFYDVSEKLLMACYIGFALLVLVTLWLAPPRRRKREGVGP
jgi:hypothetical protein